jgi:hypothetical protein
MNTTKEWQTITKQEFQAYEGVRASGVTNMWAVDVVSDLSGLDQETIVAIMDNYSQLNEKFPDVRKP